MSLHLLEQQLGAVGSAVRYRHALVVFGDAIAALGAMSARSVDLIITDPPYMLSGRGTTSCRSGRCQAVHKGDWDVADFSELHAFNRDWLRRCQRVLRPSGSIWVSGTYHNLFSVGHAMAELGYHILNLVTWYKSTAAPNIGCRQLTHSCEWLIWAAPVRRDPLAHTFNYDDVKRLNGGKQLRDMWPIKSRASADEKRHGAHPTQKPLALLERILQVSARRGHLVLDPFLGSGTTAIAALRAGCQIVGVERDVKYFTSACRRVAAETR